MSSIRLFNLTKSFNFVQSVIKTNVKFSRPFFTTSLQKYSDESNSNQQPSEGEIKLSNMLKSRFPNAKTIEVVDISGGCGAMYTIFVETSEFKNMRTVKQHQLINECLKAEIKNNMHGLRIQTAVPKD